MKLEDIGFYTLSDDRAKNQSTTSPLYRGEMVLTSRCNFRCPYCRPLREDCVGDMPLVRAKQIVDIMIEQGLKNIRFSGGEPLLYKHLSALVSQARSGGVNRIAISTNGSFPLRQYQKLIDAGVNDFSISLDACCAAVGETMCGGVKGAWNRVISNIESLSKLTYVTVGVVLTPFNLSQTTDIVHFAHDLGVADVRIIPAAQHNRSLRSVLKIKEEVIREHPILKFRVSNFVNGHSVRGMTQEDCRKCHLVLDDVAVAGEFHFPCIIYLRERGNPIGKMGINFRREREKWFKEHDCYDDKICRNVCLDVCRDLNNKIEQFKNG